jgi:hypothetical protein
MIRHCNNAGEGNGKLFRVMNSHVDKETSHRMNQDFVEAKRHSMDKYNIRATNIVDQSSRGEKVAIALGDDTWRLRGNARCGKSWCS